MAVSRCGFNNKPRDPLNGQRVCSRCVFNLVASVRNEPFAPKTACGPRIPEIKFDLLLVANYSASAHN